MNRYKIILSLFVLVLFSQSCKKDYLEINPPGQLTSESFFKTEDHAIWATNAVYNMLRDWNIHVFTYLGMTDIVSDDADKGSLVNDAIYIQDFDAFTYDPGHGSILTLWNAYYQAIYRANIAIINIPNIDMDVALRTRLEAECRVLRAYYYFNLVQWFGDIPLIVTPLNPDQYYNQTRATTDQVYAQIITDLQFGIDNLPLKSSYAAKDLGRVSKGTAQGLLAKVCLTRHDYANAEKYALDLINSGTYSLYSNFSKMFQKEGENCSESIFEVQCVALESGTGACQYNQVQGVRGTPNLGWGFNRPSDNLVSEFEQGDPRRDATILYVGEVLPDGSTIVQDNPDMVNERYNQKAWVPAHVGFQENGPGNIRLLRYADILLVAAEALNENGKSDQALTFLNMVRTRARGTNPNLLPNVTVTDKDQLRLKIWHERRVELAMEQHRWFDLVRQGRAAQVMQGVGKNFIVGKNELFPIPQREIDLSGGSITQNQNY